MESQISSEIRPESETRYLVSYFLNGLLDWIGRGNSSSFGGEEFIDGQVDFPAVFAWVEDLLFLDSPGFEFFMGNFVFLICIMTQPHGQMLSMWREYWGTGRVA